MYSPKGTSFPIVAAENLTRASKSKQAIRNAASLQMLLPRQGRPFPEQLSRTSYASPQSTEMATPLPG